MIKEKFDFYDKTVLKSYDLDSTARYQLKMLDSLDNFTRKHSESVANITCRICDYLHLIKILLYIALLVHIYMILEKCLFHLLFCKNLQNLQTKNTKL